MEGKSIYYLFLDLAFRKLKQIKLYSHKSYLFTGC